MFEKLQGFIGDNPEALQEMKSIEATAKANVDMINTLERKVGDITTTRDKFKDGNSLVKSILGIDAVNEETLKNVFKNKDQGDEALTAEITNLKTLLENANTEKSDLESGFNSKIQTMALDNAIASSNIGVNVANPEMYKIVTELAKNGAVFEDGKIVYKKSDGTTQYNGSAPMTLDDKISNIQSDKNYSGLFKPDSNGGSGTPPNNKSGGSLKSMTRSQFTQTSPEAQSKFMADGGSLTD